MRRITFTIPWPLSAEHTREILSFIFQTALVTYLGLFIIESFKPGFVTFFYNLQTFLWIAIISGVLAGVWPMVVTEAKTVQGRPAWKDIFWLAVLVFGTVLVVWDKFMSLGRLAGVIALLCGLIVLGLSLLVYYDRDDVTQASR